MPLANTPGQAARRRIAALDPLVHCNLLTHLIPICFDQAVRCKLPRHNCNYSIPGVHLRRIRNYLSVSEA